MTLTMRTAGALLAGGGIVAALFGAGLPRASADPEEEIVRLSQRYAYTTCAQLMSTPDAQGVNISVGDVMDRNGVSRREAEQVVAMSVRSSCPQFNALVQQVAPGA